MITTTLNEIKECPDLLEEMPDLLSSLENMYSDNHPIPLSSIATESKNGIEDALQCLFHVFPNKYKKEKCYLLADIVEAVLPTYKCPNDDRSRKLINEIRGYGDGKIDYKTLAATAKNFKEYLRKANIPGSRKSLNSLSGPYVALDAYNAIACDSIISSLHTTSAAISSCRAAVGAQHVSLDDNEGKKQIQMLAKYFS